MKQGGIPLMKVYVGRLPGQWINIRATDTALGAWQPDARHVPFKFILRPPNEV